MASAAEQLARNLQWSSFAKAKDLQARIWFTLIILVVYRVGTFIPIPGIDMDSFSAAFEGSRQGILGMFNMFSGGAVERLAIFALNVMPYISASIIIQLLASFDGRLGQLKKDGEQGRQQLNQYTRYLTVVLAIMQSYGIAVGLQNSEGVVSQPGVLFVISTVITLTGGTMFLMWMGEQITARGIGNGVSLIIFAGIVAELPRTIGQVGAQAEEGTVSPFAVVLLALLFLTAIVIIVFVERSQRRVLVQYPKRQVAANRPAQAETSFLPLKVNTAGVIPPIFASSLLLLPSTIMAFAGSGEPDPTQPQWVQMVTDGLRQGAALFQHGQPVFTFFYGALIIFFCFFYTSIVFNTEETADNLRKNGGFLPGIRPGARTAEYLDKVMTRLTVIGALYIALVCIIPEIAFPALNVPFALALGGTSILIVVSVTIDTVSQIQSHMLAHQYEGMLKRGKGKGKGRK